MIKKLKLLFTLLYLILSLFSIKALVFKYSDAGLLCFAISLVLFLLHLFSWASPKKFFDLCWKITRFLPDNFDYDTSYANINLMGLGILLFANLFVLIAIIIV